MPSTKSKPKQSLKSFSLAFEAIGTQWIVEIFDAQKSKVNLEKLILARIETFDKNYSRFRADSLVTKMSRTAGRYVLPNDAESMRDL